MRVAEAPVGSGAATSFELGAAFCCTRSSSVGGQRKHAARCRRQVPQQLPPTPGKAAARRCCVAARTRRTMDPAALISQQHDGAPAGIFAVPRHVLLWLANDDSYASSKPLRMPLFVLSLAACSAWISTEVHMPMIACKPGVSSARISGAGGR